MDIQQLLIRTKELRLRLVAVQQMFSQIENGVDDAFGEFDQQCPESLHFDLTVLQRIMRRYQESKVQDDFEELIVGGRPKVTELAVESDNASEKVVIAFKSVFENLSCDSPDSVYSSWHRFEIAFRSFLLKETKLLSTLGSELVSEIEQQKSSSHLGQE